MLLFIGLVFLALAVVLALRALATSSAKTRRSLARIDVYGFNAAAASAPAPKTSLRERVDSLAAAAGSFADRRLNREEETALRRQLYAAGLITVTPPTFLGYRVLATIVLAASWLWLLAGAGGNIWLGIFAAAIAGSLGWVAPMFFVKRRAADRLDQIDYEMPELVDLLVTAVEGGLGFSASLQLALRSFEGPLGQDLRIALQEQSMGLTMNQALTNLVSRTDTAAVRSFVQAVIQGETLGVSIGKILRDLADEMRRRRRQQAEERAHKAGTKIIFPIVLLIFPALFVVTLVPILINFAHGLGAG
jgi:tight adherence protein C